MCLGDLWYRKPFPYELAQRLLFPDEAMSSNANWFEDRETCLSISSSLMLVLGSQRTHETSAFFVCLCFVF